MNKTFDDISRNSDLLTAQTEALNSLLERFEELLNVADPTVPAWVPIPGADHHLGYTKSGSKWSLQIRKNLDPGTDSDLLKASRLFRVRAAHALEALADELLVSQRKIYDDLDAAVHAAEAAITKLGG